MRKNELSKWRREDIYPWSFFLAGVVTLTGQFVILLRNLPAFQKYPDESTGILMGIFSITLLFFVGAAFMYPWTVRTYSRTFNLDHPESVRRIEAILKEAGISYRREGSPARMFFIFRPNEVLQLDRPAVSVQIFGTERPRPRYGSITRVYVGKYAKETKEETRRLLRRLDTMDQDIPRRMSVTP